MEARDAIVSWLEQGDNFVRVTAASPFSPSARRGHANVRDVAQAEGHALEELAAFVNRSLPRTNWDARHAKQMLKHYLMEYRAAAEATATAAFSLGERDELRGLTTVTDKLDALCRHFQRLQQLHDPVAIATKERERARERERNEQQTTYVKLQFDLTEAQRRERETDVVPESDLSHSCENSETDKKAADALDKDNRSSTEGAPAHETAAGPGTETEAAEEVKEGVTADKLQEEEDEGKDPPKEPLKEETTSTSTLSTRSTRDKKKGKSAKAPKTTPAARKQEPKAKAQQSKDYTVVPTPPSVSLTSEEKEEDEDLPVLRRSTRAKRRSSWSPVRSERRGENDSPWIKRKQRRVKGASVRTGKVELTDVAPTQTTQAASSSTSEGSQDAPVNDENTPSGNTRIHDTKQPFSGDKRTVVPKVAPASKPTQPVNYMSSSYRTKEPRRKRQAAKDIVPPPTKPNPASCRTHTFKSTHATSLRSAIAQVVSQRQQLLSRQAEPKRQRSLSESDYGLSDIDIRSALGSTPHNAKPAETPRSRLSSAGLLPPLIDRPQTFSEKSNLERKRAFFRAKELAFEQLKWQRENEFQQLELDLLRREMGAREDLAQQELHLKRMRIRADIIQPMISAGASAADIAEWLRLL